MLTLGRFSSLTRHALWRGSSIAVILGLLMFSVAVAASGGLDITFSGDGRVNTDVNVLHPGWDDRVYGAAIQSNGKVVTAGYTTDDATASGFAIVRYNANGSLDTTFSGDGKQVTSLGGFAYGRGVAIQSDGKILVVGDKCATISAGCDLAVARYNANGMLDTTFAGTGRKVVDFGGGNNYSSGGVAIQADGKIVAAGAMWNGTNYDLSVFRFNPNGSLDTTFSGDGKQNIGFGAGSAEDAGWGRTVAIQTDGKIVLVGDTNGNFGIARLKPNGSLDTTFSGDGRQTTDFGASDLSQAVALQSNGKIVVVGEKMTATLNYIAVARYNPNGTLDTTFNGTGKKLIDFAGSPIDWGLALALQSTGKIVVAGRADTNHGDFALARLNSNGALDTTFSGDGKATFDFHGELDRCRAIAVDSSGRYVLAGFAFVGGQSDFAVARVLP